MSAKTLVESCRVALLGLGQTTLFSSFVGAALSKRARSSFDREVTSFRRRPVSLGQGDVVEEAEVPSALFFDTKTLNLSSSLRVRERILELFVLLIIPSSTWFRMDLLFSIFSLKLEPTLLDDPSLCTEAADIILSTPEL
eukprot:scaffold705_cov189-Chaetoceros_neogracile.AAC.8